MSLTWHPTIDIAIAQRYVVLCLLSQARTDRKCSVYPDWRHTMCLEGSQSCFLIDNQLHHA